MARRISVHLNISPRASQAELEFTDCLAAASVVYERIKNSPKLSAITQVALARGAKVHQSQVSRILKGKFVRVSKNVMRICKFADISFTQDQPLSPKLQKALQGVWDGSPGQEAALVQLLNAASGIALAHSSVARSDSRRSKGRKTKHPRK